MSTHTTPVVFDRHASPDARADVTLSLSLEQRQKARLRARASDGREVALMLERGHILRGGTRLTGPDRLVLEIRAAPEAVSQVHSSEPRELIRAAYHLGNRHVAVQIGPDWLRYLADHVLDDMLRGLGMQVGHREAAFEPESGAYAAHRHALHSH